ncbi:MAG: class I SAM-dependent methyltransferase [Actinomycetota bacterium]
MTAATPTFDPARYKAEQQRIWDAAAPGWRRWGGRTEGAVAAVGRRLVGLAKISSGDRVLDVATGIGEPALTAARWIGPTGLVTATDISPAMVDIARERVANAGLLNVEFRTIDAEELDFPDASFDAALCRFGLMFFPDVLGVLGRVLRALTPGASFAAAVWREPRAGQLPSIEMDRVMKALTPPPLPLVAPGGLGLGDGRRLTMLMERAGFEGVRTEPALVTAEFESLEQYSRFLRETTPEITGRVIDNMPEGLDRLQAAVTEALSRHAEDDGRVRLSGAAVLVGGRRPARPMRRPPARKA